MDAEKPFDQGKSEAFAGRLLTALNDAALCLMTSIGHRTGLLDVMRALPSATPEELARKARLHERYVREWLGAMATARVVEVDPATGRYRLPPEHAAFLTRAGRANNVAVFTQYVALLGAVEDDIVRCFEKGGGVPYEKFPRFHAVMAEESGLSVGSSLESHVLPLVPGVVDRLRKGIRVLDVGCGSGRAMNRLAELFPASTFHGVDLSGEAVGNASGAAAEKGLRNVAFTQRDVTDFHETAEPEAYDFVTTFDAIHDQAWPLNVLRGIHRTLRRDGVYLMQDVKGSSQVHDNLEHPVGTFLYTISCMHCMTVSLARGGEGLGAMWGEEKTRDYLARAGFRSVEKHELPHDIQNNWYVVRK
jgi:2-polyprenyl-3-methyl-5-hydroxy-6-metoxy-1,4-benzoquinol methylase